MVKRHIYREGDSPIPGYKLLEPLGKGNFGEVWKASAPGGLEIALKIITLGGREGEKEFHSLQRIKHIRHPFLVSIFASWLVTEDGAVIDDDFAGVDIHSASGRHSPPSIQGTMMLPAGRTLSQPTELIIAMTLGEQSLFARLDDCKRQGLPGIPRSELIGYMEGAASGIDFLNRPIHKLGDELVPIVHGDIKPQNLLIVGDSVLVCDFGLAKAIQTLRMTSAGMGTFAYAAPELLSGKPTLSSDQYCLAISYIELCTGELPFSENTPAEVIDIHRRGELDLSRLNPQEREVVQRAVSVDPAQRWPKCIEMVRQLRRACEIDDTAFSSDIAVGKRESARIPPPNPPKSPRGSEAKTEIYSRPIAETDASKPPTNPGRAVSPGGTWLRRMAITLPLLAVLAAIAFWFIADIDKKEIRANILEGKIVEAYLKAELTNRPDSRIEYAGDYWRKLWASLLDSDYERNFDCLLVQLKSVHSDGKYKKLDDPSQKALNRNFEEQLRLLSDKSVEFIEIKDWQTVIEAWESGLLKEWKEKNWFENTALDKSIQDKFDGKVAEDYARLRNAVLEKAIRRLDSQKSDLAGISDAMKEIPAEFLQERRLLEKIAAMREDAFQTARKLAKSEKFADMFSELNAIPASWLEPAEGKAFIRELLEELRRYCGGLAKGDPKNCRASFAFIENLPEKWISKDERAELSKELLDSWSARVSEFIADGKFDDARIVLEQAPLEKSRKNQFVLELFSAELRKTIEVDLDAAVIVWKSRPSGLSTKDEKAFLDSIVEKIFARARKAIADKKPSDALTLLAKLTELKTDQENYKPLKFVLTLLADQNPADTEKNKRDWKSLKTLDQTLDIPWKLTEIERTTVEDLVNPPSRGPERTFEIIRSELENKLVELEKSTTVADVETGKKLLSELETKASDQEQKNQVAYYRAFWELSDSRSSQGVSAFLDYLKEPSPDAGKVSRLCEKLKKRLPDLKLQAPIIHQILESISVKAFSKEPAIASLWQGLWMTKILPNLDRTVPTKEDLARFDRGSVFSETFPDVSPLLKLWRLEGLLQDQTGDPPADFPSWSPNSLDGWEFYGHYVQAKYLAAKKDDSKKVAEELIAAFQQSDRLAKSKDRLEHSSKSAISALDRILDKQKKESGFDNIFSIPEDADLAYRMLHPLYKVKQGAVENWKKTLIDKEVELDLALAAIAKPKPEPELANEIFERLTNDEIASNRHLAVRLLYGCLGSTGKTGNDIRRIALASRFCEIVRSQKLDGNEANTFFSRMQSLKSEAHAFRRNSPNLTDADRRSLLDFYENAGDVFAAGKDDKPWPEGWQSLVVDAYRSAVDLAKPSDEKK